MSYNSAEVLRQYWSTAIDAAWTVVDNASSDGSVETARSLGAHVIALAQNVGFAAANNRGVAESDEDVLIFCNPDVQVTASGIATLAERVRREGGIIAPQLVNPDGSLQENGRGAPTMIRKVRHMLGRHDDGYLRFADVGESVDVVWAMGAAVAVRRSDFERLGGWDEGFFIYYEDSDICMRAHAAGMRVRVDGDVRWTHGWGRETRRGFSLGAWRHELRSAARFYRVHPHCLLPFGRFARRIRQIEAAGLRARGAVA
ncbi:glycosyltransferase family 2 protein [Promicromonospora sp. NPDC057138]|uniref:glycosyltransferase family 2 protein n=1 Tax=Promicromonospora sp. NPDC057138 TaxID=3346031 RepID=UPI003628C150